jgi:hypothetical protein
MFNNKAWVGSTSIGMQFLCCIPASMFVDLFMPLTGAITGGILSTISLILTAFVNRIEILFVTYR